MMTSVVFWVFTVVAPNGVIAVYEEYPTAEECAAHLTEYTRMSLAEFRADCTPRHRTTWIKK